MRPVTRVAQGERWFPDGIGDIVAHTDGRFLAVTVMRDIGGRCSVVVDEFDCADGDGCLRPLVQWLATVASLDGHPIDEHVLRWADFVATRLVAAMAPTMALLSPHEESRRLGG